MSRRELSTPALFGVFLGVFTVVVACGSKDDGGFMIGGTGGGAPTATGAGGGVSQGTGTGAKTVGTGGSNGTPAVTGTGPTIPGGGATGLVVGTKPPVTGVGGGITVSTGAGGGAAPKATEATLPPATAANCTTDLLTTLGGADGNWMANTEQTCGMQGAFYGFSDTSTCAETEFPPCVADATSGAVKCCFKGTSSITKGAYGCGIGFDLAAIGTDKTLYKAPATGLTFKVSGTAAAGLHLRASVSTGLDDSVASPMIEYKGSAIVGSQTFSFATAKCPTGTDAWASGCVPFATAGGGYAFKLQVVGGEYETATSVGDFDLCIESIMPIAK